MNLPHDTKNPYRIQLERRFVLAAGAVPKLLALEAETQKIEFAWYQRMTALSIGVFAVFATLAEPSTDLWSFWLFVVAMIAWLVAIGLGVRVTFLEVTHSKAMLNHNREYLKVLVGQELSGIETFDIVMLQPDENHIRLRRQFIGAFTVSVFIFSLYMFSPAISELVEWISPPEAPTASSPEHAAGKFLDGW